MIYKISQNKTLISHVLSRLFTAVLLMSLILPLPAKAGTDAGFLTIKDIGMEILKGIATTVQKKVLDGFTNQAIKWIQGGAKGEPGFVSDFSGFLTDAVDQAAGQMLEAQVGNLCEPFKVNIKLMLLPVPEFGERVKCSISDLAANVENFARDFRNGDWSQWIEIVEPQNNIYGAYFLTLDAMKIKADQAKESAKTEITSSGGFLSRKTCVALNSDGGAFSEGPEDKVKKDFENAKQQAAQYGFEAPTMDCTIETPGSTVASKMDTVLKWDSEWLINSDSVAAALSAIVDATINKVTEEGLRGAVKIVSGKKMNTNQVANDANRDAAEQLGDAITNYTKWNHIIRIKHKIINIGDQTATDFTECNPEDPDAAVMKADRSADLAALESLKEALGDILIQTAKLQKIRKEILKMPKTPTKTEFEAASNGDTGAITIINNYKAKRDAFIAKETEQFIILTEEEKQGLTAEQQSTLIEGKKAQLTEEKREQLAIEKLSVLQEQSYEIIGPLTRLNNRFNNMDRKDTQGNVFPSPEKERLDNVNVNTGAAMVSLLTCLRNNVNNTSALLGKLDLTTGTYETPNLLEKIDQFALASKLGETKDILKAQNQELFNMLTNSGLPIEKIAIFIQEVYERLLKILPNISVNEEITTTEETKTTDYKNFICPAVVAPVTSSVCTKIGETQGTDPATGAAITTTTVNITTKKIIQVQKANPLNISFPIDPAVDIWLAAPNVVDKTYGRNAEFLPINANVIGTSINATQEILNNISPNMTDEYSYNTTKRYGRHRRVFSTRWPDVIKYFEDKAAAEVEQEIETENKITFAVIKGGNIENTNPALHAAIVEANNLIPPLDTVLIQNARDLGLIRRSMLE